jgi:AhpD family alkylhydroperoxidase
MIATSHPWLPLHFKEPIMTRIIKLDPADWDPELRQLASAAATPLEQASFGIFAHRPEIMKAMGTLRMSLKKSRTLPERLLELVRLRIAFHNQCRSCMAMRYRDAIDDGLTEDLVCSLEKPMEAPDLSAAEKAALAYADRFANHHLSIDEHVHDELREHFTEGQLVELGVWVAYCVGFGRLAATWDMIEALPTGFQDKSQGKVTPWSAAPVVVA